MTKAEAGHLSLFDLMVPENDTGNDMKTSHIESQSGGSQPDVWAFGGCKGGIGKSFITSSFGIVLSNLGYRTLLIDLDLGGANLHTWLGIQLPQITLSDFLTRRGTELEELIIDTGIPNLRLLNGASDILGVANLRHGQKLRLMRAIRNLKYDYILLDLGGGTTYNTLDFFLMAKPGVIVVSPEPSAVENAYRFIKSTVFRKIRHASSEKSVRKLISNVMETSKECNIRTPYDLLKRLEECDQEIGSMIRQSVESFSPKLLVNLVRDNKDREIGRVMSNASRRFFGIEVEPIGLVPHDEAVWRAIRMRKPYIKTFSNSVASQHLSKVVANMLEVTRHEQYETEHRSLLSNS